MKDYSDHYDKYLPVYEELSTSNGGKTVWIPTDKHDGWYVNESVQDKSCDAWNKGYPLKSRPSILPDDLSSDVERTAYTTISYALDESYETKYYRKEDGEVEWMNSDVERLPDYGDIVAWSLFVDIDIDKKYKQRPLPEEHKDIISSRLNFWIKAFAEMGGDINKVFVLDSGGGMYVFLPPTALSPVSDRYDREDLNLIFNELGKRMRTVTGELDDLICQEDSSPKEIFSADKVQNKNRQFKTIGSIHKSLDAVVYPIQPEDVEIKHKKIESITNDDIKKAKKWAESFTSDKHRECVDSVVEYLFQGDFTSRDDVNLEYIEGESWKSIIDNWLENKKDQIQAWEHSIKNREEISEKKLRTDITQDRDVAKEAIRRINNQKLKDYIVNYLGEERVYEKNSEEMDFFPFWRAESTETGRSAFYDFYEGKARFTDKADGTSRDIVYWVALEMTYDDEQYPESDIINSPSEDLEPYQYSRCIKELRDRGEDIPILVPELEDDDSLSDWRIRQIALELGIATQQDIIKKEDKQTLKPTAWNRTIDRLDKEGINHNCDKRKPLEKSDIKPPSDPDSEQKRNRQQRYDLFFNSSYHYEAFDSKEDYCEFIESLPKFVVPFVYNGKINDSEVDGVVAGVFVDQDQNSITLSGFEPLPYRSAEGLRTHKDVTMELNEKIDKKNMRILTLP